MVLIFLIVFGVVVGMVASHKGRSFFPWFLYGAALFPIGLTHAILVRSLVDPVVEEERRRRKAALAGTPWFVHAWRAVKGHRGGDAIAKWYSAGNDAWTGEPALDWQQRAVVKLAGFLVGGDRSPSAARPPQPSPGGTAFGVKCPRCGLLQMGRPTCKGCGAPLGGAP